MDCTLRKKEVVKEGEYNEEEEEWNEEEEEWNEEEEEWNEERVECIRRRRRWRWMKWKNQESRLFIISTLYFLLASHSFHPIYLVGVPFGNKEYSSST